MTQLEVARNGKVSAEMEKAAAAENMSANKLRELIAAGRAVIPKNEGHEFSQILAIGEGLRTKVNANIGTSGACTGIENEMTKLDAAAAAGADFFCYVTPAEHLSIPNGEDVRAGVIATRIAGHSADIAKGIAGAIDRDREMSIYRRALNWEGMMSKALDPDWARERVSLTSDEETCTMCSDLCAVKLSR